MLGIWLRSILYVKRAEFAYDKVCNAKMHQMWFLWIKR